MANDNTREWDRLRKVLERVRWGEVTIFMQNGKPVRVEAAVKTIKLDGSEDDFAQGLSTVPL